MRTVSHHGRETAYRVVQPDETGPTVLYVHGSGANHSLWTQQYGPDGPAHPAVALDLSGHGESDDIETEAGPETLEAYAADLAAVGRAVDASVLVGNSLGGAVVLRTVLSGEYEPDGLVLAGTGAKLGVHEQIQSLLADDFEGLIDLLHEGSRLLYEPEDAVVEQSVAAMRATGRRVTRRDYMSCHTFDVRDQLGAVELPALAVVGEHDTLTPPEYHEYLASELPACELRVVPDAAHLAMVEQPADFNEAAAGFFDRRVA